MIGPITRTVADRRRIRYGCLTPEQFDDLERLWMLTTVTLADVQGSRRKPASVVRAMHRYMGEGWVERVDAVECWRLTTRGWWVFRFALEHLDSMIEGDGDE